MRKKDVAVLEFGSSRLTMLVGTRDVNNTFNIKASEEVEYAGFMDGEFLRVDELMGSIREALVSVSTKYRKKINRVYVGVPSEFCYVKEGDLSLTFKSRTKIAERQMTALFSQDDSSVCDDSHTVINKGPIYYTIDNSQKIFTPLGSYANSVTAHVGFILADNYFIDAVSNIFNNLGIIDVDFICTALAEGMYLIPKEDRVNDIIIIDCGYISTSIAKVSNDALTDLKSFSLGGGFITSDLSEVLNISFDAAEQLKRKLIICVEPDKSDMYEALGDNEIVRVPMKRANDIAFARIDMIAEVTKNCIDGFDSISAHTPVFITGGGLSYIVGIKDYLSKVLDRKIEVLVPVPPQLAKPELSGVIALLDMAITMEK